MEAENIVNEGMELWITFLQLPVTFLFPSFSAELGNKCAVYQTRCWDSRQIRVRGARDKTWRGCV